MITLFLIDSLFFLTDIYYVIVIKGMDIIPDLIDHHKKSYKDCPWTFRAVDVLQVGIQESYDLILNRMMLQHLYYNDVVKLLQMFSESGSKYLLSTTFSSTDANLELQVHNNPGRFRKLNLEAPPISLVPPLCLVRDGPGVGIDGWAHFFGLWKLPLKQVVDCTRVKAMKLKDTSQMIYSCVKWSPYEF